MRAVRETVGAEVPIAIDGHGRLNPTNAREMVKRIEPYGILFFEAQVLPESVAAIAELRRKAGVPVDTGECLFTRYPFREYWSKVLSMLSNRISAPVAVSWKRSKFRR